MGYAKWDMQKEVSENLSEAGQSSFWARFGELWRLLPPPRTLLALGTGRPELLACHPATLPVPVDLLSFNVGISSSISMLFSYNRSLWYT